MQGFAKKRRMDFHVKQYVLADAVQSGSASSCSNAAKSLNGNVAPNSGLKWRGQEMSAYRAASILAFSSVGSVSVALDGARIGRPAKEILAGFIYCDRMARCAALPPQVASRQRLRAIGWVWGYAGGERQVSSCRRRNLRENGVDGEGEGASPLLWATGGREVRRPRT